MYIASFYKEYLLIHIFERKMWMYIYIKRFDIDYLIGVELEGRKEMADCLLFLIYSYSVLKYYNVH